MKGSIMAKRSSLGSIVRKRLSDITNSQPQPKSPVHCENLPPTGSSTKDYIDSLLKENMALVKLIGDKNKIIEFSGIELQKLRVSLQKMQLQNWNLAQSNSHMLAELNLGKEKLKALQHELVCKDALLKVKNLELEGQDKMNGQNHGSQHGDEAFTKYKSTKDNKACNGSKSRRRPLKSPSMGPLTTSQQVAGKEMAENKRRCLRRQSARFKSCDQEPRENLFELEDINYSDSTPLESPMHVDNATSKDENIMPRCDPRDSQRTSFGRPSRKAAVKVQSYKEIPLNIKMRRSE